MKIGYNVFATNIILFDFICCFVACLQQNILNESREKAKEWLMKQRKFDWSWGVHTHRAIIALSLSSESFNSSLLQDGFIIKQLQIQLSKELRNVESLPPYQIALYIQALLAICLDPRNFNGYNLLEELNKKIQHMDTVNTFLPLALCNARFKNDLLNLEFYKKIMTKSQHPKWEDAKAWLIMTFICSIQNVIEDIGKNITDFRFLISYIDEIGKTLNSIKEGSIQNIHSIAIVAQVLFSIEKIRNILNITDEINWGKENTIKYLLHHQQQDGSFGNIITTYLVLPVLFERSLLDLRYVKCNSDNFTQKIDLENETKVPPKTSFYEIMRLASELNKNFRFRYFKYPDGIYVYSLADIINEPESDESWQLYSLKGNKLEHIDESPDKIFPKDGDNFVYWYSTSTHLLRNKQ
ncbi:uncharacterized protein CG3556-like [Centruroides sculpturatus]|uniref:uncharacterized protein CG3556-like n=1 Tax=Centruroides sculpturatus TaxID=218467 RepID=UPI000C6CEECD|nr:uncharacterized protein CG3556-like [Centruroides sculpturatus]